MAGSYDRSSDAESNDHDHPAHTYPPTTHQSKRHSQAKWRSHDSHLPLRSSRPPHSSYPLADDRHLSATHLFIHCVQSCMLLLSFLILFLDDPIIGQERIGQHI